ncbi:MAG: Crp/Fnr family transcriptional regulator [Thiomargarita sp.]|nr:Crp/Fnr family transcriptional regulator [Thiomargarita sp.]
MILLSRQTHLNIIMHYEPYPSEMDDELRKLYLFSCINDEQFNQIKQSLRYVTLTEGEYLFKHGQHAERFFMVKEGFVKLLRLSKEGSEKVFEVISPNQFFAEAIMFMPKSKYPVTAQAIGNCTLLCFDNKTFIKILKESSETCFRLMSLMSKYLHLWLNEIDNLTLQNATYRLINYLLYQIPIHEQEQYEFQFPIPKNVIASRISIKPETFSRILHDLSNEGLIMVKGKTINIYNVEKLRVYSINMPQHK